MKRECSMLVGLLLFAPGVAAQSLNVDFGPASSTPGVDYAGAGNAGFWNTIEHVPQGPVRLSGLDGLPTVAGLFVGFGGSAFSLDDPATKGADELLMDDFMPGLGDVVRQSWFVALESGHYRVITYGWTPLSPNELTSVAVNEQWSEAELCGGEWPGGLQHGVTHTVHHANVLDGTLYVYTAGGHFGASGNINGIQLIRLGDVCLSDWNHDGVSNSQDFFDFLAAFFDGFADFNGDETTNSQDFFDFLTEFFAGC